MKDYLEQSPIDFSGDPVDETPRRVSHNRGTDGAHFPERNPTTSNWREVVKVFFKSHMLAPFLPLAVNYAVFHAQSFSKEGLNFRISRDNLNELTLHSA
jgi:hypothetical protein